MVTPKASAIETADELRRLAALLDAAWPSMPLGPEPRHRRARGRLLHAHGERAGELLIAAADAGTLPADLMELLADVRSHYGDDAPAEAMHHSAYLHAVQQWLPTVRPGFGGRAMTYPDADLEAPGPRYPALMRAIADVLAPQSAREAGAILLGPFTLGPFTLGQIGSAIGIREHSWRAIEPVVRCAGGELIRLPRRGSYAVRADRMMPGMRRKLEAI